MLSNCALFRSEKLSYPSPVVVRLRRYVPIPYRRSIPLTTRAVLARDNYTCGYCGGDADTTDHIVPRARGGKHDWLNVVAACGPCNRRKGRKSLDEWGKELRVTPKVPRGTSLWVLAMSGRPDDAWLPYLSV